MSTFRAKRNHDDRLAESRRIRSRYSDRVPIIVERGTRCQLPQIDKHKYLCPMDMTMGEFMWVLRQRIKLDPSQAMFLLTEHGTIPTTSSRLSDMYDRCQATDGFLYLTYTAENTFGTHLEHIWNTVGAAR